MTVKNSTWQLSEVPSESSNAETLNEQEGFSTAPPLVLSTMAGFDSHKGSETGAQSSAIHTWVACFKDDIAEFVKISQEGTTLT